MGLLVLLKEICYDARSRERKTFHKYIVLRQKLKFLFDMTPS
jgi:hypothetical protein